MCEITKEIISSFNIFHTYFHMIIEINIIVPINFKKSKAKTVNKYLEGLI